MKGTIDRCSEKPADPQPSEGTHQPIRFLHFNRSVGLQKTKPKNKISEKGLADKVNIICLHYKRKLNCEFISELKAANKQTNRVNKNKETMKAERTFGYAFSFIQKPFLKSIQSFLNHQFVIAATITINVSNTSAKPLTYSDFSITSISPYDAKTQLIPGGYSLIFKEKMLNEH